ncbi:uncharacterized protein RAG0_07924 [Rhynchosporium agropyri]|uniref:Uncharacterized protein n=1 Tax=Rhynchosporium agropyri TaxID=914238 RepID=A0A1E1KNJ5_9HELO|nr:uncharacterized protein RAG0_07924 [Rhynchosporium agropyri]
MSSSSHKHSNSRGPKLSKDSKPPKSKPTYTVEQYWSCCSCGKAASMSTRYVSACTDCGVNRCVIVILNLSESKCDRTGSSVEIMILDVLTDVTLDLFEILVFSYSIRMGIS